VRCVAECVATASTAGQADGETMGSGKVAWLPAQLLVDHRRLRARVPHEHGGRHWLPGGTSLQHKHNRQTHPLPRTPRYWCTQPSRASSACAQIGVRAAIARRAGCRCAFRRRPRASRRARCVQRLEQNRRPRRCSPLDRARKRRPTRDPGAFFAPFWTKRLRSNRAHPFSYHMNFALCPVRSPGMCLQVRCCPSRFSA
jgi:hypothetical protein